MTADNRTLLNDASANTGWTGDDTASTTSAAGDYYEGGSALSTQLSNALERMYTTSIGGTRDMSDASVWILVKDNLQSAKSAGGGQVVLHDNTDNIGFYCNGNDDPGLSLPSYYNCLKLDVSNRAALSSNAYAGSAANLTVASITGVGYGTIHLSKAVGSIDNVWMDASYFILNTSYALTINGGTVGTPETWGDVSGDDVTNGWGMVANLQGSKYDINGSWEWGDTANADSYFNDSNFQVYIDARDMGTGNFLVRTIAGSGTNSLVLTSGLFQNLGTPSVWDLSDPDMNILEFTAVTFTDVGAITFPTAGGTSRFLASCIFNNCAQLYFDDLTCSDLIINGSTNATGAVLFDTAGQTATQTDFTFNSDGTGHGIVITTAGTYNLSGWAFNGYSAGTDANGGSTGDTNAAIYNNSGGLVTLNISGGGDTPTVLNGAGASTTVNNNVSVTLTGMRDNTEVRVLDNSTGEFLDGIEDATAGTADNRSFTFSLSAGTIVDIAVFNVAYILPPNNRIENFEVPTSDTTIPLSQVRDRNYKNPA